jgi:hypothetical protein
MPHTGGVAPVRRDPPETRWHEVKAEVFNATDHDGNIGNAGFEDRDHIGCRLADLGFHGLAADPEVATKALSLRGTMTVSRSSSAAKSRRTFIDQK